MDSLVLPIVSIARALVEVAGCFLLGQGALFVLAGNRRERNLVYRFFRFLTRPVVAISRRLLPRSVPDRIVPLVAFLVLFLLWIALALLRQVICGSGSSACS